MAKKASDASESFPRYSGKETDSAAPPGYKWTEVGVIQEEWKVVHLQSLCDFITKGSTPTTYGYKWESDGVLFLRSECVSEKGLDFQQAMFISESAHKATNRSEIRNGDILITITGNVGRVVFFYSNYPYANINQHIARIRVNSGSVIPGYVFYYLARAEIRKRFESITTGQAYPQIGLEQVRDAMIALPPAAEQRAIAEALSDADAFVSALDALIAKKRAIKAGAMEELLSGKKQLLGRKDSWSEVPIGKMLLIIMGQSPDSKYYNLIGEGLPLIQGNADIENRRSISRVWTKSVTKKCHAGDLILTVRAPVGYIGVASEESCLGRGVCALRPTQIDADFAYHALVFAEPRWRVLEQGSTFTSANSNQINEFIIKAPVDIAEQRAIAAVLSDMDAEIAALEARRDKARHIKDGMMEALLTGKIRLVDSAKKRRAASPVGKAAR